jgi:hypothetical protein
MIVSERYSSVSTSVGRLDIVNRPGNVWTSTNLFAALAIVFRVHSGPSRTPLIRLTAPMIS